MPDTAKVRLMPSTGGTTGMMMMNTHEPEDRSFLGTSYELPAAGSWLLIASISSTPGQTPAYNDPSNALQYG